MRLWALGVATSAAIVLAAAACSSFEGDAPAAADAGPDVAPTPPPPPPSCDPGALDSDPKNCGACGHDCLGGACKAGACQPVVVGRTTLGAIDTIAVDRDNVYWNAQVVLDGAGNLATCPKTGCSAPLVLSAQGQIVGAVASDGDSRIFAGMLFNQRGLYQVEGQVPRPKVSDLHVRAVSVTPTLAYFASFYEAPSSFGRSIYRWDGVTATRVCSHAVDKENIIPVAYTKDRVYLLSNNTGNLYTCLLADTEAPFAQFASGIYANQVTATADRVFWAVDGVLSSCPNGATCTTFTVELDKTDVPGGILRVTGSGRGAAASSTSTRATDASSRAIRRRVA